MWLHCSLRRGKRSLTALKTWRAVAAAQRRPWSSRPPISAMELLYDRIKLTGPLTVAGYMKGCLLHPVTGYYMKKDVFGAKGDFTTSPEVSQIFGELLAVWVLADWMVAGEPPKCQLIELGPGRGTLLKDMLRVFGQFSRILKVLSVHLVEASPAMCRIQEATLTGVNKEQTVCDSVFEDSPYKSCILDSGVSVSWYLRLEDIPSDYCYVIAHEFFDALPVHQFQKTAAGWREVIVDIDPQETGREALRFVLAPSPTPASTAFSSLLAPGASEGENGEGVEEGEGERGGEAEVCPEGLLVAKEIGRRVAGCGGAALIADYGEETVKRHTLRGFKGHQLHNVLVDPGCVDLTADVDFGALTRASMEEGAGCAGPMTQNEFLHKMGIRQRLEALLENAGPSQAEQLLSGYEMLTSPEQMGQRFKFLTITSSPSHIPTPFAAGLEPFPTAPSHNST